MYTLCPECQVAFRINAEVLQQARGQVRCGSCGIAFNALDHLYEEPPRTAAVSRESSGGRDEDADERSRALLETLDRLAGPDEVRIEDTGVEWLVLDENDRPENHPDDSETSETGSMRWFLDRPDSDALSTKETSEDIDLDTAETAEQPVLDEQAALQLEDDEPRYDDNTPLPDDFGNDDDYVPPTLETPRRRSTDQEIHEGAAHDDTQAELELSEPGDWTDLLDEVVDERAGDAAGDARTEEAADVAGASEISLEVEEELAAIHDELSALPDAMGSKSSEQPLEVAHDDVSEERPPSDADTNIEEVASGLDELLESMGSDTPRSDEGDESADVAPSPVGEAPDGDTIGDAEESAVETDEAAAEADDEQIAKAVAEALPDDGRDVLTDEHEALDAPIEYEESTGEFERAIAEAEGAIKDEIAKSDADSDDKAEAKGAEDQDAAPETDLESEAEGDSESDAEDDATIDFAAMTSNMQIDPDLLRAMKDADLAASMTNEDGSPVVETIVMEGDFVRGALDAEIDSDSRERVQLEPLPSPESLVDTYMMSRRARARSLLGGRGLIAVVVVLVLLLAGQYVHTARESLATNGLFNRTIGSVYRMLGSPVTPKWDIKGWQFETTSGSTAGDDELLTIYSRISNRSDEPLPYPLVHVSLTDRYEEIIGSRVLEPNEYLAGNADPSRPVAAGGKFTAVVTIAEPAPDATGFKLNVCYRDSPGRVRCAIEDFKAP